MPETFATAPVRDIQARNREIAMSFKRVLKQPLVCSMLRRLAEWRVREKIAGLTPYLTPSDKILDIGAGNCVLCRTLKKRRHQIVPLDIDQLSFFKEVQPVIYDGRVIPFADRAFDVSLLITVLHHIPEPEATLAEAKRVCKRIVMMEEIYTNRFEQYLTYFIDSLFNMEFAGHPHTNKTDAGWRAVFQKLGLTLVEARYSKSLGVLTRAVYLLEV